MSAVAVPHVIHSKTALESKKRDPRKVAYALDMTKPKRTYGPYCPHHPETALICPRCIAAIGGKAKSAKKAKSSRQNIKKANRWPKHAPAGPEN